LPASLDTYWHSAHLEQNYNMVPQHPKSMHCCFFAVAAVQSEETESWGAESDAEESGIPTLQLASFVAEQDGR
jgi:hypothetical protein